MKSLLRVAGILSLGGLTACETELAELTHLTGADNQAELVSSLVELDSTSTNINACISLPSGTTPTATWTVTRNGTAEAAFQTVADVSQAGGAEAELSREGYQWHCHLSGDVGVFETADIEVAWTFDVTGRELVISSIGPYTDPDSGSGAPSFSPLLNAVLQEVQPGEEFEPGNWALVDLLSEEELASTREGPLDVFRLNGKAVLVPVPFTSESSALHYVNGSLMPYPISLTRDAEEVQMLVETMVGSDDRLLAGGTVGSDYEVWSSDDGINWQASTGERDYASMRYHAESDEFVALDGSSMLRLAAGSSVWHTEEFAPDAVSTFRVGNMAVGGDIELITAINESLPELPIQVWRRVAGGSWEAVLEPAGAWGRVSLQYLKSAFYAVVEVLPVDETAQAVLEVHRSRDGRAWDRVLASSVRETVDPSLLQMAGRLVLTVGDGVFTSADGRAWVEATIDGPELHSESAMTIAPVSDVVEYGGHALVQLLIVPGGDDPALTDTSSLAIALHTNDGKNFCAMPSQLGPNMPGYTLFADSNGVYQLGSDRNGTVIYALETDGLRCGNARPRSESDGGSMGFGLLALVTVLAGRRRR